MASALASLRNCHCCSQPAQTASTKLSFDAWQELLASVKALLSPRGKVTASQAAGTITVCDHPDSVRRAGRLIAEFNARFERQCALRVNVYSLELKDESSAGLDLKLLFQKAAGADLACDSVTANDAPDDAAVEACKALGAALA